MPFVFVSILWHALSISSVCAQVIISEFMASNSSTLKNDFGEYSDWLELYNPGDSSVNLSGWTLSDDISEIDKWTFPNISIQAGEFLLVYASDLDVRDPNKPLHLNFKLKASGEFLGLFDNTGKEIDIISPSFPSQKKDISFGVPMGADLVPLLTPDSEGHYHKPTGPEQDNEWLLPSFNPEKNSWSKSTASVGYETIGKTYQPLILTRVPSSSPSIYLRLPFTVENPNTISDLVLSTQSDDGFIAYLNGTKIAGFKDVPNPKWDSTASSSTPDREALIAKQMDISSHINLLKKSNILAIHLLNSSVNNSDLLWVGSLSARFSFENINLTPKAPLTEPTPLKPNTSHITPTLTEPEMTPAGGVFESRFSVTITHPDEDAEIRFTTDGSLPTKTSKLYTRSIPIRTNAKIRARAFKQGFQSSSPSHGVYIFKHFSTRNLDSNLPFVILQKQTTELISDKSYTPAQIMIIPSEEGKSKWEVPDLISSSAIKTRGSSTANRPKPSLSLELQDHLGNDIDKQILGMPPESDWVLWGPFQFDKALMRNPFIYEISRRVGRYAPRTRFVEVFITPPNKSLNFDDYFGVYAVIEKIKRDEERVDIKRLRKEDNDGDAVTGGYLFKIDRVDPGDSGISAGGQTLALVDPKEEDISREQKIYLRDYVNAFNESLSQNRFDEYIDVNSWVDHHILNEFTKNPDEFRLSAYMYKPRNGKIFAGPIWDFDRTMGNDNDPRAMNPTGWSNWTRYGWYNKLLNNRDFKQSWIDRYQDYRTGPMSTKTMLDLIDEMADELRTPAQRNFEKWPSVRPDGNRYQVEVQQLKTWITRRGNWIDSLYPQRPSIQNNSGEPEERGFLLNFSKQKERIYYRFDGLDPRLPGGGTRRGTKQFNSGSTSPVTINNTTPITARAKSGPNWSSMLNQVIPIGKKPEMLITEIHYHPVAPSDSVIPENDLEFIEIFNPSAEAIQLHDMTVQGGIQFIFPTFQLESEKLVLLAKNPEALMEVYGLDREMILGPYEGNLSNSGDSFSITDTAGREILFVKYSDDAPWPETPDGTGPSLEIINLAGDLQDPFNWKPSPIPFGTPGLYTRKRLEVISVSFNKKSLILRLNKPNSETLEIFSAQEISNNTEWTKLDSQDYIVEQLDNHIRIPIENLSFDSPVFLKVSD